MVIAVRVLATIIVTRVVIAWKEIKAAMGINARIDNINMLTKSSKFSTSVIVSIQWELGLVITIQGPGGSTSKSGLANFVRAILAVYLFIIISSGIFQRALIIQRKILLVTFLDPVTVKRIFRSIETPLTCEDRISLRRV